MKLIIPAAGIGTRLKPLTDTTPKPLLHVAGKPMLEHILERLDSTNISEAIFITGHIKKAMESYVAEKKFPFKTRCIYQDTMLGTAHAINLARNVIEESNYEDVLIIFADTICDADFNVIKSIQNNDSIDGLMWVKAVSDEEYKRFGIVEVDNNGIIKNIVEKPEYSESRLANIGFYYIKNSKQIGRAHV